MSAADAYAPVLAEVRELLPEGAVVIDAHTHLGLDEDGRSLDPGELLEALDLAAPGARACTFPLHDPERHPGYRLPNDRVLEWAYAAGDRLYPYCRLDPAEDPVAEAQRCLARGARGIKLHPRAQAFGFGNRAAESIWKVAQEAGVPILIHAGRGMPPMDALAELALRFPDVVLILAHAAIADQGMFASRLAEHPSILYDTSTFSPFDQLELFARVPAERIVFASDIPYGFPPGALHAVLRLATYAGLDAAERRALVGGTMLDVLEGRPLAEPRPPRVPEVRPMSGRLARINGYLLMAFAAFMGGDADRLKERISLARAVCRDPEPGTVGAALERIDGLLSGAETGIDRDPPPSRPALGLVLAASAIAATEPVSA